MHASASPTLPKASSAMLSTWNYLNYDVPAPVSGIVIAINEALRAAPELINSSPYEDGWIYRIRLSNKAELADLVDAGNYLKNYAD
jgi:glycine cleavage system H protein